MGLASASGYSTDTSLPELAVARSTAVREGGLVATVDVV